MPMFLFLLLGAVKKNCETAQQNRKDVERAVSKWLVGGRDRDGNRAIRARCEKTAKNNESLIENQ